MKRKFKGPGNIKLIVNRESVAIGADNNSTSSALVVLGDFSASYEHAVQFGQLLNNDYVHNLTKGQIDWLVGQEEEIENFLDSEYLIYDN